MAKHNDNLFRQVVTGGLQKAQRDGIGMGAHAMCKVILEKAQNETKTAEERLADIIKFCVVCTNPKELKKEFKLEETE